MGSTVAVASNRLAAMAAMVASAAVKKPHPVQHCTDLCRTGIQRKDPCRASVAMARRPS